MRIVLVGRPADRARLRAEVGDSAFEVAAEFGTMAEARAAAIPADAILLADEKGGLRTHDEEWVDEPLTPREHEVLELLAEGLPNKAIAARLGISDQTVKFHVASITGKLGASNRTDAVRRAVRRGLIRL